MEVKMKSGFFLIQLITYAWRAGFLEHLQWSDLMGGLCVRLEFIQGEGLVKSPIPLIPNPPIPLTQELHRHQSDTNPSREAQPVTAPYRAARCGQ